MRFFSAFKLRQKFFPELKAGAKPVDGFQEFYERNAPNHKIWGVRTLKKYASSHIQTILSVSEFAHVRVTDSFTQRWSRTIPPVGTCTPPRRIPVIVFVKIV